MSKTVHIDSIQQFHSLISSSSIVVADFYADWCGPCKQIAPVYEQLSAQLSRPNKITFTKINVDNQSELARTYGVTAMPTFMIFKNARNIQTIKGADPKKLHEVVKRLANEANAVGDAGASGFGEASIDGDTWLGAALPRGFRDVTDQVDIKGLELLNFDGEFGSVRTLFEGKKPSSLRLGKEKDKDAGNNDWIKSDTDEQIMLYVPFQSTLKIHSIHLTSILSEQGDEEVLRPKTVRIYKNRAQILSFDEADDSPVTQEITLLPKDWDTKTGTAKIDLRYVIFQNVTSLVVFVVDGEGDGDSTRLDRVRIIGETGEKRDPGKLEKVGEDD